MCNFFRINEKWILTIPFIVNQSNNLDIIQIIGK